MKLGVRQIFEWALSYRPAMLLPAPAGLWAAWALGSLTR